MYECMNFPFTTARVPSACEDARHTINWRERRNYRAARGKTNVPQKFAASWNVWNVNDPHLMQRVTCVKTIVNIFCPGATHRW